MGPHLVYGIPVVCTGIQIEDPYQGPMVNLTDQ